MKYQVADYVIDTALYRISTGGVVVPVEPKVFNLLVYLVRHRDRVLTREELFQAVWDGREVSDTTLSNHVKIARKALGDNGDLQKTIQTIRGRGYQFIAPVVEVPEAAGEPAGQAVLPVPGMPSRSARPRWPQLLAVAILVLVAAGLFGSRYFSPTDASQRTGAPNILVVPIEVSGTNPVTAYQLWSEELTRRVIGNLRQISGMHVKERATSFNFQENRTHDHIRKQLPDVRYVLSGVLDVSSGKALEVTMYLDDLQTDKQLWSRHYALMSEVDVANLAELQSTIAASVARTLRVTLLEDEQRAMGRSRELSTQNRKALELYMEGWRLLPLLDHESLKKAIALFDEAIALDGDFYDAYLAKGEALLLVYSYWDVPRDVLPKVVAAFGKAEQLRPDSAEPLSALGLTYALAWDWARAWKYLNAARARNPNLAMTELGFALYYCGLGEAARVKESLKRARDNDPLNVILADWGNWALFFVGEIDASREWANDMMDKHPGVGLIVTDASISAYLDGDHARSIKLAEQGHSLDPSSIAKVLLAQAYGYAGQNEKVRPLLAEAESAGTYTCPYESAVAYLSIGDSKTAMQLLEDAYRKRSNCLLFLRVDPRLEPIRKPPYREQYLDLLARVGLDEESWKSYPR